MITDMEMLLLGDLADKVSEKCGFDRQTDLRPIAQEIGLDIDRVMEEIINICETEDYNVGSHMYCTRENVIPHYKRERRIRLDKDHTEGLLQILAVHYGVRKDY